MLDNYAFPQFFWPFCSFISKWQVSIWIYLGPIFLSTWGPILWFQRIKAIPCVLLTSALKKHGGTLSGKEIWGLNMKIINREEARAAEIDLEKATLGGWLEMVGRLKQSNRVSAGAAVNLIVRSAKSCFVKLLNLHHGHPTDRDGAYKRGRR